VNVTGNQCRQPPSRPDMHRRDMPMPGVLLVHGVKRRLLQGERVFDESGEIDHARSLRPAFLAILTATRLKSM
jgi:hypothetical protein